MRPILEEWVRDFGEFIRETNTSKTQEAIKKEKEILGHDTEASLRCRKTLLTSLSQYRSSCLFSKMGMSVFLIIKTEGKLSL